MHTVVFCVKQELKEAQLFSKIWEKKSHHYFMKYEIVLSN